MYQFQIECTITYKRPNTHITFLPCFYPIIFPPLTLLENKWLMRDHHLTHNCMFLVKRSFLIFKSDRKNNNLHLSFKGIAKYFVAGIGAMKHNHTASCFLTMIEIWCVVAENRINCMYCWIVVMIYFASKKPNGCILHLRYGFLLRHLWRSSNFFFNSN